MEPTVGEMVNIGQAQICSTLANVNRGKKGKAYKLKDFLIEFNRQPKKKQSQAEMWNMLRNIAAENNAMNARRKAAADGR